MKTRKSHLRRLIREELLRETGGFHGMTPMGYQLYGKNQQEFDAALENLTHALNKIAGLMTDVGGEDEYADDLIRRHIQNWQDGNSIF